MHAIHVSVRVAPVRGALNHGDCGMTLHLLKFFIIIIIIFTSWIAHNKILREDIYVFLGDPEQSPKYTYKKTGVLCACVLFHTFGSNCETTRH